MEPCPALPLLILRETYSLTAKLAASAVARVVAVYTSSRLREEVGAKVHCTSLQRPTALSQSALLCWTVRATFMGYLPNRAAMAMERYGS